MINDTLSGINEGVFDAMCDLGVAQEREIDGRAIQVVFDNDKLKNRQDRSGVVFGETLMYCRTSDLDVRPKAGRQMRVGRHLFYVTDCVEQDGILEVTLSSNAPV